MGVAVQLTGTVGGRQEDQPVAGFTDAELDDCVVTTSIAGGFDSARIGITPNLIVGARGLDEIAPAPFAHGIVTVDGTIVFEGRLSEPGEEAGWVTDLPLDGYFFTALEDHTFDATTAGTVTGSTLAIAVVQEACPAIVVGTGDQWTASVGAYVPANYTGQMPSTILDLIVKAGHPSGYPLDFRVWNDRVLWSVARIPPEVPDFIVGFFDPGLRTHRSVKGSYGALSVLYTAHTSGSATIGPAVTSVTVTHGLGTTPTLDEVDVTASNLGAATTVVVQNLTTTTFDIVLDVVPGGGGATFGWEVTRRNVATPRGPDATYGDRMGIARNARITADELTNAQALAYRDAQLAIRAYPTVSRTLSRKGGWGLRTPAAEEVPAEVIRSGGWVWVEGDIDRLGRKVLSPIVTTELSCKTRGLKVGLGMPMPGLVTTLAHIRDADAARRAGVNPLTGGRRN